MAAPSDVHARRRGGLVQEAGIRLRAEGKYKPLDAEAAVRALRPLGLTVELSHEHGYLRVLQRGQPLVTFDLNGELLWVSGSAEPAPAPPVGTEEFERGRARTRQAVEFIARRRRPARSRRPACNHRAPRARRSPGRRARTSAPTRGDPDEGDPEPPAPASGARRQGLGGTEPRVAAHRHPTGRRAEADLEADAEITQRQLADALDLDKGSVSRPVRAALDGGYLVNREDRRGKPHRLVLGDPLPDDVEILPSAERLAEACKRAPGSEGVKGPPPSPPECDTAARIKAAGIDPVEGNR